LLRSRLRSLPPIGPVRYFALGSVVESVIPTANSLILLHRDTLTPRRATKRNHRSPVNDLVAVRKCYRAAGTDVQGACCRRQGAAVLIASAVYRGSITGAQQCSRPFYNRSSARQALWNRAIGAATHHYLGVDWLPRAVSDCARFRPMARFASAFSLRSMSGVELRARTPGHIRNGPTLWF
jgi:hypothetical protein